MILVACKKQTSLDIEDPAWVKDSVSEALKNPVQNPPLSVSKCLYKNKIFYFLPSPCCDQFDYLYDFDGDEFCAPSGGITGYGNGKCSNFFEKADCKEIWRDER